MGADGGINWVNVTGDAEEFYRLITPLSLNRQREKCYDEYHDDYLEAHPLPIPKKGFFYISTYGTGSYNQGMDDLQELIRELENYQDRDINEYDGWHGTDPLKLTWKEVYEDYYTSDQWGTLWHSWRPLCVTLINERLEWCYDKEICEIKKYDDPIFHITLGEWLDRIKKVIDLKSFGSAETWT